MFHYSAAQWCNSRVVGICFSRPLILYRAQDSGFRWKKTPREAVPHRAVCGKSEKWRPRWITASLPSPPLPLTCAGVASHEPGITTHDCDRRQVRRQPLRTIIAVLRGTVFISTLGSSFFPARTHPAPTPNKRETSLPPQKVSTTFLPHPLNTGP